MGIRVEREAFYVGPHAQGAPDNLEAVITDCIDRVQKYLVFMDEESDELLTPGPCGEYLETIDFDPATNTFYKPIDLSDPYLLAQDGLAPSDGNPQFHQQMVYEVAMRTIRNFEIALSRRALWASHDSQYVGQLRIYQALPSGK